MKAIEALDYVYGQIALRNVTDKTAAAYDIIRKELEAILWKDGKFKMGDRVRKKGDKGQWHGHIVGFYTASCTEIGYAVESERETGSVQIYPETALEHITPPKGEGHE